MPLHEFSEGQPTVITLSCLRVAVDVLIHLDEIYLPGFAALRVSGTQGDEYPSTEDELLCQETAEAVFPYTRGDGQAEHPSGPQKSGESRRVSVVGWRIQDDFEPARVFNNACSLGDPSTVPIFCGTWVPGCPVAINPKASPRAMGLDNCLLLPVILGPLSCIID